MKYKSLTVFMFFLIACNNPQNNKKPLRWLEDISFDLKKDKKDFTICNGEENIYQYFNYGDNIAIEGDKPYIINHFEKGYKHQKMPKENGLIRIRFIVNCQGETDRFRIIESDLSYKPKKIAPSISQSLLSLTKSLKGWKNKLKDGRPVDYYQYLVFRIEDGRIMKILP